jgi:hypothetical protein
MTFRRNAVPSPSGSNILLGMLNIEDEDTVTLLNITNHLPIDMASHLRRRENSFYLLITVQTIT